MATFEYTHDTAGFSFQLRDGTALVPVDSWSSRVEGDSLFAVSALLAELETGRALAEGTTVLAEDAVVAALPRKAAASLGLPPLADCVLELTNDSTFDRLDFRINATWRRPSGQAIAFPKRNGCLLLIGETTFLLPFPLFSLADAIDRFHNVSVEEAEMRIAAWARIQSELPEDAAAQIRSSDYLSTIRIHYATAFTLSLNQSGGDIDISPVLHRARIDSGSEDTNLLPQHYRDVFGDRFRRFSDVRSRYQLGDGQYVILSPTLERALGVVRRVQKSDAGTRRGFARNPRSVLHHQMGSDFDEVLIESLFVETADYSNRVREIGLWQPKVLPWITLPRAPWLPPEQAGLMVGQQKLQLSPENVPDALKKVQEAIKNGEDAVIIDGISVPANAETVHALEAIAKEAEPRSPGEPRPPRDRVVLIIEDNLDAVSYEPEFERRTPELLTLPPNQLISALKPHQLQGVSWLQSCWQAGRSGVLLADDMGLGKTLQALVFLAWLREGMTSGKIQRAPILIVAPTGLLSNWEREHDLHLTAPGLGTLLRAHGSKIKDLRVAPGTEVLLGQSLLDERQFLEADWILTTYESVRDYQHTFGRIPFAAVVFDEVQKIKTPGILITEAAKALKRDFVIAMTGTPIENRLSDLWCIMDTVQGGYLGDLKDFSRKYEASSNPEDVRHLKNRLQRGNGPIPAILMRRMKEDKLEGLPPKVERIIERQMPEVQTQTYREVIARARSESGKQNILQTLHKIRSVSLHPLKPGEAPDDLYIASSARYQATFDILDNIAGNNEKALIFLEFLADQAFLATLIQRRYGLAAPPMLINGGVSGTKRQERVDQFQRDRNQFDAMILSPRAGGVGLTLTAANHVIHLSRWWNPAVEDQCTDRVYRIGQDKEVFVYYPMSLFPDSVEHSFDRRLNKLLMGKRALSRDLLCSPEATDADAARLFEETVLQD